jgi:hypothetical protein
LIHEGGERSVIQASLRSQDHDDHVACDLNARDVFQDHGLTQNRTDLLKERMVVFQLDAPPAGPHFVKHAIDRFCHDATPERHKTRIFLPGPA